MRWGYGAVFWRQLVGQRQDAIAEATAADFHRVRVWPRGGKMSSQTPSAASNSW